MLIIIIYIPVHYIIFCSLNLQHKAFRLEMYILLSLLLSKTELFGFLAHCFIFSAQLPVIAEQRIQRAKQGIESTESTKLTE